MKHATVYKLGTDQVAEYKEVFQLMDRDQDQGLSFHELCFVMRALGQRLDGEQDYLRKLFIDTAHRLSW